MSERLILRVRRDDDFRIKLLLLLSLIFDAVYSVFLFLIGRSNASWWFLVMPLYYGLLFFVRMFIFSMISNERKPLKGLRVMRLCGIFLLFINLAVAFMMLVLIRENEGKVYNEIIVIALAAYTFFALTLAIIESVGQFRRQNYIYFCAKLMNLICASVSMTTLTDIMLSTFGDGDMQLRHAILPLLCVAVSIFIVLSAMLMIRKANYDMRVIENEEKGQ